MGVGLVCGLLNAVYAVSYVGLAFPGPLAAHLPTVLGLGLLASAIASIVAALVLRYPGSMAVISPEAMLVIGAVGVGFAEEVAPAQLLPTMLATVTLVTLATAAMLYGTGRARLGYLMHYLPFPVVAGLIGGLGVLLVIGGLELAVPELRSSRLGPWMEHWRELAVTALFGTALWLLNYVRPSVLNLPGGVLAAALVYWSLATGSPLLAGWAMHPIAPAVVVGPGQVWAELGQVDWQAVAGVAPTLAMLVLFLCVIVLTDAAGMELAVGRHFEPDQTLATFGIANAAAGMIGGFVSVMSLSGTVLAHRGAAACRLVGVVSGLVALGFWLAGPELLAWIPSFVVGGLIVFVGLEFVGEWVILQWLRLSPADRAILVAVVAGVSLAGFAVGFVVGLLLGFVFFVVSRSRLHPVRHETTGR